MITYSTAEEAVRALTDAQLRTMVKRVHEGDALSPEYSQAVMVEARSLHRASHGELLDRVAFGTGSASEAASVELSRRVRAFGNDPWWC